MTGNRREQIKDLIMTKGSIQIEELVQRFPEVSVMTIRRDLTALEAEGSVIRIRGGARANSNPFGVGEDRYKNRETSHTEEKGIVSERAMAFLEERRSLFFDAGTTIMTFARKMPDKNYVLFTTAPNIALEVLWHKQKPQVSLLGGLLSRNTLSASGTQPIEYLKTINIDIAFMATSGFSLCNGFTSGNPFESQLKAEVVKKARKVIMLATTNKIERNMPYTFAGLQDIDVLIFEKVPNKEIVDAAEEYGVEILC